MFLACCYVVCACYGVLGGPFTHPSQKSTTLNFCDLKVFIYETIRATSYESLILRVTALFKFLTISMSNSNGDS